MYRIDIIFPPRPSLKLRMDDSPNDLVAEGDIFFPLLIMSFGVLFPVKFHFSVMWIFFSGHFLKWVAVIWVFLFVYRHL